MDKVQALHSFWSSFGLKAYDEQTVPDDAVVPYITYNVATDSLDNVVPLTASLWYRGTEWEDVTKKADQIAEYIGKYGHVSLKFDGGYLYITKGSPFAQRVTDASDELSRRIYINIMAEFLTAY